jgi:hypothetical protein
MNKLIHFENAQLTVTKSKMEKRRRNRDYPNKKGE